MDKFWEPILLKHKPGQKGRAWNNSKYTVKKSLKFIVTIIQTKQKLTSL